MSDFIEQLRLAERAAENIYFEKVNRELIEALHREKMLAESSASQPASDAKQKEAQPKQRLS